MAINLSYIISMLSLSGCTDRFLGNVLCFDKIAFFIFGFTALAILDIIALIFTFGVLNELWML